MSDRTNRIGRRELLVSAGCVGLTACGPICRANPPPAAPLDADEAVRRLKEGNARFAEGRTRHAHESARWRKHLVAGQKPFAALLGCSDSRVPVELVFDQGFGDLFVIRVAGNVIAEDVFGSIQYAGRHLGTRLFVVLGHEGCGAVSAALSALSGDRGEASHIRSLLRLIEPGLAGLNPASTGEARLRAAVEANVRWSVRQLAASPEGKRAVEEYGASILGAVYDLESGAVRFLD